MRVESLDAIRGIAALIVLLHHMKLLYWDIPGIVKFTPLRALFAGGSSVIVFFILSGFVLQLAYFQKQQSYLSFIVKRLVRIYIPFAASILVSAVVYVAIQSVVEPPHLSEWATRYTWSEWPTSHVIWKHLAMTDSIRFHMLNNVMWSLVVELRISLIFPLIALFSRRKPLEALAASLVVWVICSLLERSFSVYAEVNPVRTLKYVLCFVIGALLYENVLGLKAALSRLSGLTKASIITAGIALYSLSPDSIGGIATIVGSATLVAFSAADPKFGRLITNPITLWLGRVSYSLYLVHIPIIFAVAYLAGDGASRIAVILMGGGLSLIAADIFQRAFERPSILLGRYLGTALGTPAKSPL